jgi:hypothetical protein
MLEFCPMSTAEIIAELPRLSAADLAQVRAKVDELADTDQANATQRPQLNHPALGMWKDRTDLPADSVEASKLLREQMMRHEDSNTHKAHS